MLAGCVGYVEGDEAWGDMLEQAKPVMELEDMESWATACDGARGGVDVLHKADGGEGCEQLEEHGV